MEIGFGRENQFSMGSLILRFFLCLLMFFTLSWPMKITIFVLLILAVWSLVYLFS